MDYTNYAFYAMTGIAALANAGFGVMIYAFRKARAKASTYRNTADVERQRTNHLYRCLAEADAAYAAAIIEINIFRNVEHARKERHREISRMGALASNAKRRKGA